MGTEGKVESDQQYRGFRFWYAGGGSQSSNNHFTRNVKRPDGSQIYVGYGIDSITVALVAVSRVKFLGASVADVKEIYPTAEDGRITAAIVDATRIVRDRNFEYLRAGKGAVVTAQFGPDGIVIVDPYRADEGPDAVFEKIYDRPV